MALRSLDSSIDNFSRDGISKICTKPLSTGFDSLDKALGGGLAPGLTFLGAIPGLGKSTFAFHMASNVAASGTPVLIFSLEVPESFIEAKLISCRTFLDGGRSGAVSSSKLLMGSEGALTDEEWEAVDKARESLKEPLKNIHIEDGSGSDAVTAKYIADTVTAFVNKDPEMRPLVIVDYLQFLAGDDGSAAERKTLDATIKKLAELAASKKVYLFVISSLNRSSYRQKLDYDAFKETGSIEYSADTLIGMQFRAVRNASPKKGYDIDKERSKTPRELEFVVLKQRYGQAGISVDFDYFAEFDCFADAGKYKDEETEEVLEADGAEPGEDNAPAGSKMVSYASGTYVYFNNTNLSYTELRKDIIVPGSEHKVNVGRRNEKLYISYKINTADGAPVNISYFDIMTADAVYSAWVPKKRRDPNAPVSVTLNRLLCLMVGHDRCTLTPIRHKMLWDSLLKLARTEIEINCAEENAKRSIDGRPDIIKGRLIPIADLESLTAGGEMPKKFMIEGSMPLFDYAEPLRQIISIPIELMGSLSGISDAAETMMIKHFITKRLEVVRNPNNNIHGRIAYFPREGLGLARNVGIDMSKRSGSSSRSHKLAEIHDKVTSILDRYTEIGYINGYKTVKEDRSVTGVDILPFDNGEDTGRKIYVADPSELYPPAER